MTTEKVTLSFIVPTYNYGKYIDKCINSLVNQTHKWIEIIIVNDGSTDNTREVVEEFEKKYSQVKGIHIKNGGVSNARNVGLTYATGDYVAFVDADDYISNDYAEYMLGLVEGSGAQFGLSKNWFIKKGESQVKKDIIEILTQEETTTLLLSPAVIVGSWNKIYKRSLLQEYGITFTSELFYGEGLRFIIQVSQKSNFTAVGRRKVYYYRRNNYASACTKFNVNNFHNGLKSIDIIGSTLQFHGKELMTMFYWHKCQFYMGAAVRIKANKKESEYSEFYKECVLYVRKNCLKFIFVRKLSLYKRLLLVGCAISPYLMGCMDNIRRRRISAQSV